MATNANPPANNLKPRHAFMFPLNVSAWVATKFPEYPKEVSQLDFPQIPVMPPKGKVLVSDRRFLDRGHAFISYPITGNWLALSDPLLARLVQSARNVSLADEALSEIGVKPFSGSNSSTLDSKPGILRLALLCFIFLPSCLFAAKLLVTKLKQKQKIE